MLTLFTPSDLLKPEAKRFQLGPFLEFSIIFNRKFMGPFVYGAQDILPVRPPLTTALSTP